ncbi:MAG: diadenylate cyclase CdaA [Ruminococcus sp.]|nr:diadenylate cyclase CdaA [Ruminococcus sp.]
MEVFQNLFSILKTIQVRDVIDIIAIALIIFGLFRLIRETRAIQLLKGILLLLLIYFISSVFELVMLSSLLRVFFEASVIIIAIIFQPEIRKALEQMGRNNTWRRAVSAITKPRQNDDLTSAVKKSIVDAADTSVIFSRSRTGALIVFERQTMLSDIAATGTVINADTSVALFGNIFYNKAPLHDGASIIRGGKLHAAGCILPLTDNPNVDINLGTRHRAALGISEISDAVVLIVSEETGVVSLAIGGSLIRNLKREKLIKKLNQLLLDETDKEEKTRKFRRGRDKQ